MSYAGCITDMGDLDWRAFWELEEIERETAEVADLDADDND